MNRTVIILLSTILCLVSGLFIYTYFHNARTAYINTSEVYNEFALKKDLEEKLKYTTQTRKIILDSLKLNLQVLAKSIDQKNPEEIKKFSLLKEQYFQKEKQFKEDDETLAQKYTEQIWNQLNQYIKDFGAEHQYKYIFGVNGEGTLMYADEAEDITTELQQYVNKKFHGK